MSVSRAKGLNNFILSCNLFGIVTILGSTGGYCIGRQLSFSYKFLFQICILLKLLGDGAVQVAPVMNCCIY